MSFLFVSIPSVHADVLNEWGFGSDPAGKTLSQAINIGTEGVAFTSGNEAGLATDGTDVLICTTDDSGTEGMWTNGAILDAALPATVSAGVQYLRWDFSYDLSDTNSLNDSGCLVGFSFYDGVSNKLTGVALGKYVGAGSSPTYEMNLLSEVPSTGRVAVVARVNLTNQTMDVWYDVTGDVSGFSETSPTATVAAPLSSFDSLRFQATGDIQPAGSTDDVRVDLLRTADTWDSILTDDQAALERRYSNEWTFERDLPGTSLNQALNSGTNSPLAQFDSGFDTTVFTTNRAVYCIGEDGSENGVWTNGAILNASLAPITSGKHYLRYDVAYDFSSPSNDSGNVLGVYFTDESGGKVAGIVLGNNRGGLQSATPANYILGSVTNGLPAAGTITAIAEVDLDGGTLNVWYDLSGANVFDLGTPDSSINITLTTIDNLRFHATGDFRPAGSSDYAAVDNIRQAASWSEIVNEPEDLTAPPSLSFSVSDSLNGLMDLGETNIVTVVVSNTTGSVAATQVTTALSNDLSSTAFTIVSNNPPVDLNPGESVTNTYELIAQERGFYTISISISSAETNPPPSSFSLVVGSHLSVLPETISEPGGTYAGIYEPGETLNITITTTNDGGTAVSGVTNSLTPVSAGFAVSAQSPQNYASLAMGASTSTVYQVVIGAGVTNGTYFFSVTNSAGGLSWSTNFSFDVFLRQPGTDWIKANNSDDLNLTSSWASGLVPDETDRAVMDATVSADINTDMGSDLAFGGIALISNTASWTISGTNTLTLGSMGFDMLQAGNDLTVSAPLVLSTPTPLNVVTSRTLTVSGNLTWDHPEPLVKDGDGTLTLSGENIYSAGTIVSNGILSIGSDEALGTGLVTLDNAVLSTAAAVAPGNDIELIGNTVFDHNHELTVSGIVSGTGSLTKTGSGTLILSGANTYSGGTTNNGVVEANSVTALGSGDVFMNSGSVLQAASGTFTLDGAGIENSMVLNGDATLKSADYIAIDGSISGTGKLTATGNQIILRGDNSFSGGLHLSLSSWLRFYDINAFGSGPITMDRDSMLLAFTGGNAANDISLTSSLRLYINNRIIELSGLISGSGSISLLDGGRTGTLILSGDNSGWTGNLNDLSGRKTLEINHANGLMNVGKMTFGSTAGKFTVVFNAPVSSSSDVVFKDAGEDPVEFLVNEDTVFSGAFSNYSGTDYNRNGLLKTGSASLTLNGPVNFSTPVYVNSGTLVVNTTTFASEQVVIASGAVLDLRSSPAFAGGLAAETGSRITLAVNDDVSALTGAGDLELAGTLLLDFANYGGANSPINEGDVFTVLNLGSWSSVTDNGLSVLPSGLPPYMSIDDSNLFVNGTVEIIASRLSDQSLTITVPAGMTADESITLTNASGGTLGFMVRNDGTWLPGNYAVTETNAGRAGFYPAEFEPDTVFNLWNGSVTVEKTIGFDMPVFATPYTSFEVSRYGFVTLKNGAGETAILTPFQTDTPVAQESVRYRSEMNRLVVSWTVDTGLECQIWLNADGTIWYLYQYGAWSGEGIGLQNNAFTQPIAYTPGTHQYDCLLLTPSSWVSCDPEEGSVVAGGRQIVTFTADASVQTPGEYFFTAPFVWSDGSISDLAIFVIVTDQTPHLELPSTFAFSGPAGWITRSWMTVSNSGNYGLDYTITDRDLQNAGYTWTNVNYGWQHIPDDVAEYKLSQDQLGAQILDIGFPFVYFGNTYTSLVVNADGTLSLGSEQSISPFGADLSVDDNASVRFLSDPGFNRFTVTWKNMDQSEGSLDQTFQAVLKNDGTIRFNYQSIGAGWTNGLIRLVDPSGTVTATLSNNVTTAVTTNYTYVSNYTTVTIGNVTMTTGVDVVVSETNVVTTYAQTANNQSLLFTPGANRIISVLPVRGVISAGESADIMMIGDARSLTDDGTNDVFADTTLTFNYSGQTADVNVTFMASNSVETAYSAAAVEDMWGSNPDFTHQKNPDGSVTLTWASADDKLSRTYKVWFTTSLKDKWVWLATVLNDTVFVDSEHKNEPVIYYKITVE